MKTLKFKKILLVGFLILLTGINSHADDQKIIDYSKSIAVHDVTFNYTTFKTYESVASFGYLKNNSKTPLRDVVLEVQYFDANKKMIDSQTQELYSTVIPPNEDVSFSVKDTPGAKEEKYISNSVKVLSATPTIKCKSNKFFDFLGWFAPFIIIILVWLFIARKYSGKNSPQAQSVELIRSNNKLMQEHNELFKKLIAVIEDKMKKDDK